MSKAWEGGSTRPHRRARANVLERDGYRCQLAIPGICLTVADQAHHMQGKAVTGDDEAHMVAACKPCNLRVGDPRSLDPEPNVVAWW